MTGRAITAALCGLAALGLGIGLGVVPLLVAGPNLVRVAATLAAVAGLGLVVLALRDGLRGRGRWARAGAAAACLVAAQWVVVPMVTAGLVTSAPRRGAPPASSLGLAGARDVVVTAGDGTRLAGWYVPGTSGAAVVLLHGAHGTRAGTLDHLRMLARSGAAVLAIDARGHGASGGRTNALGWRGAPDVAAAARWLGRMSGVDPGRVAVLGLSMGGEEALRAAAEDAPLAAVVADGAGASTLGDRRALIHGATAPVELSVAWLGMRAVELLGGGHEPAALADVVGGIRVPVLLIASSASGERTLEERLRARIGAPATLWYVADAGHTGALDAHPAAYAARVAAFLDRAMPAGPAGTAATG